MHAPFFANTLNSTHTSLEGLIQAVAMGQGDDAVVTNFTNQQWQGLAPYLQPTTLAQGQVLFTEGSEDRTMYFIESGSLSVHLEDAAGKLRLAIVGAGSVVGEGAFFSHAPRGATVQAASVAKLWALSSIRFSELTHRQPALALGVAMAVGAIMARRMGNRKRRVAST
jgi:CRP/FNR family cyclic AMP-dependent transcriptional regulator